MMQCISLVSFVISIVHGANILGIVPSPFYSHQTAFFGLWKELSLRGHNVTVITTDPQRNGKLINLTEIDVNWTYKYLEDLSSVAEKTMTMWNMHFWFHDRASKISQAQLSHPQIKELIHDKEELFDIVLLEGYYPEFLGLAELYKCPSILIYSLDTPAHVHYKMGNTVHPVLYPDIGSPFYYPLSFKERVISTIYTVYTLTIYKYIANPDKEKQLLNKFFNTTSTVNELISNVDMLFVNVNPILHSVRAVGPTTINIGGLRNFSPQPLTKDLQEFLDSATDGFVYFSLGSKIQSKNLQKESLDAIVGALNELPYKVLWKFEIDDEAVSRKLKNVKLIEWAPQVSVLAHPNIKVFVTQGGLQSMEEAISNEVLCVVIPFFADQEQNARLMNIKGIAIPVRRHPHIERNELKNAILKVIRNPKYKEAAKTIKRLMLDSPMSGLEKAVWWTEYVIRNKGAKHLRNPAADLPTYQYYLIDVMGFLASIAVALLLVVYILLKKIYSLFLKIFVRKCKLGNKKLE